MGSSPNVTIRASNGLDAELAARGDSLGEILARDIRRYYAALESALCGLDLSVPEWNFLQDLLSSTVRDENLAHYLWAEVEDAVIGAEEWGVDRPALASRLRAMPEFHRLAIVDAIDRWWRAQG